MEPTCQGLGKKNKEKKKSRGCDEADYSGMGPPPVFIFPGILHSSAVNCAGGQSNSRYFQFHTFQIAPTCREPAAVQIQLAVKSKNAADFIFPLHFEQAAPLTVKTTQGVPGFALLSSLRLHIKLFLVQIPALRAPFASN